jgi:hypothetical protein
VGLDLGQEDVDHSVRAVDEESGGPIGHLGEQEEVRAEDPQREEAAEPVDPGGARPADGEVEKLSDGRMLGTAAAAARLSVAMATGVGQNRVGCVSGEE